MAEIDLFAAFRGQPGVEIEGSGTVNLDPAAMSMRVAEALAAELRDTAEPRTSGETASAFVAEQDGDGAVVTNPLRWAPYVYADSDLMTGPAESEQVVEAMQAALDEVIGESE